MTEAEAKAFIASALVLLPRRLRLQEHLRDAANVPVELRAALQELWLRTGTRDAAPAAMPQQQLAPGLFTLSLRRLRAALTLQRDGSR